MRDRTSTNPWVSYGWDKRIKWIESCYVNDFIDKIDIYEDRVLLSAWDWSFRFVIKVKYFLTMLCILIAAISSRRISTSLCWASVCKPKLKLNVWATPRRFLEWAFASACRDIITPHTFTVQGWDLCSKKWRILIPLTIPQLQPVGHGSQEETIRALYSEIFAPIEDDNIMTITCECYRTRGDWDHRYCIRREEGWI
jgi:hypothetical protein